MVLPIAGIASSVTSGEAIPATVARGRTSVLGPRAPLLFVVPRSRDWLFEGEQYDHLRDALPGYRAETAPWAPFRVFEGRFYVDIATRRGGHWEARRRLTAVLVDADENPVAGVPVSWRLTSGSSDFRFLDSGGTAHTTLTGSNAPTTDARGLCEIVVSHPARAPADVALRRLEIEASARGERFVLNLQITRNDDVASFEDIARKSSRVADQIWVYQPDSAHRSLLVPGLRDFQDVLNEVVSRHRGVAGYGWIPRNGVFGDEMRSAISQYLERFPSVRGADYPYDLSGIGVSPDLSRYLAREYAPFDPNTAAMRGWIVDRRLLIGERWSEVVAEIDGLLEIHDLVVARLRSEMVRIAGEYVNDTTFWLHRPIHMPYQAATTFVFRVTASGEVSVKAGPGDAHPDLMRADGNPVIVRAGDCFGSTAVNGAWTQIAHREGAGWVRSNSGRRVPDDQSLGENAGTHGMNGVAYSFGCKDMPQVYQVRLNGNPHAPPGNGPGNRRRIANWSEYADRHRVGRRSADAAWTGGERIPFHTGCDCSGFTQNALTYARFDDPEVRIVPNSLTAAIDIAADRVPRFAIGSQGFVGAAAHARPIPVGATDAEHRWLHQGDIISRTGHVVWVADERPDFSNNLFNVYNEYGVVTYMLPNGTVAPLDVNRFLRKAIHMPFHYWAGRRALTNFSVGKPYIWA